MSHRHPTPVHGLAAHRMRLIFSAAACLVAAAAVATAATQSPDEQSIALLEAARAGDIVVVRELLDAGAEIEASTRYGSTALFFAADRGNVELVRLLLERGANPNVSDSFYRATPLTWALQGGNPEIVQLLLEHGSAGADQALGFAMRNGHTELAKTAIAAAPITEEQYARALEMARAAGDDEIVAALQDAEIQAPAPAEEFELDVESLPRYSGMFRNENEGVIVEIEPRAPLLVLTRDNETTIEMGAVAADEFATADGEISLSFGGRGGIVEFAFMQDGDRGVPLRPVDPDEAVLIRRARDGGLAADDSAAPNSAAADPPVASSSHWPSFRGTSGSGVGDGHRPPTEWSAETGANIRWKTPIPGIANSSPVVWGDRIFVTTAVSGAGDDTVRVGLYGDVAPVDDLSSHRFEIHCLDRRTGDVLWSDVTHEGPPAIKRHTKSSQANSTPVTDGERVVVLFGSVGVLAAYDMAGAPLWSNDLGPLDSGWFYDPDYQWGHSASPVIFDNLVIVQADVQHGASFIAAYDLASGAEVWRTGREGEIPTWGSPAIYRGTPRDEIVTNGTRIRGYDPRTGEELWSLGPNSEVVVATPVIGDGLIYVTAGYPPIRPIYAIRPGGTGDISLPADSDTNENVVWSKNRGGTYIPSPLLYRGVLYTNANNGRLTAYDAASGEMLYRARIAGTGGSYVASPVAADGKLFFSTEDGTVHVVRAGREYELLGSNEMGEVIWATPAITPGMLVVRTLQHVWGIAEDE